MTKLLLARHGQTDWNLEHRWQGDPPLNDTGRAQARSLARSLNAKELDGLYSSDLARARETAEIVAEHVGLPVKYDPRLREIDVGEWVGLTSLELRQRHPAGFERFLEGGMGWERGESYDAMVARVTAAIHSIAAFHPGGHRNGDVHEVVAENGRIGWRGLAEAADDRDRGNPTVFWRSEPRAVAVP